jgi:hypothetical protein
MIRIMLSPRTGGPDPRKYLIAGAPRIVFFAITGAAEAPHIVFFASAAPAEPSGTPKATIADLLPGSARLQVRLQGLHKGVGDSPDRL